FIPLAEETGLIVPMGWWVLEESCRQFHCWRDAYPDEPGLVLHVNISAQQLHDPEAASKVKAALAASDIPPQAVILELTESSIMQDIDRSIQALSLLTSLGVHLGIDDFGTGYSSLNYLRMLPATTLKIDKSFVDEVTDNDQGAALVHAIINFGAALDLTIVAEGVESRAQATRLAELGCVCAQGYYFSRPLDAAEMDAFLAANAHRAGETSVR
ncbi:MAG: EAL domain-containing protein, partial [Woeseiaceae bacterium]